MSQIEYRTLKYADEIETKDLRGSYPADLWRKISSERTGLTGRLEYIESQKKAR